MCDRLFLHRGAHSSIRNVHLANDLSDGTPLGAARLTAFLIASPTWSAHQSQPLGERPTAYSPEQNVLTDQVYPSRSGRLLAEIPVFASQLTRPSACGMVR